MLPRHPPQSVPLDAERRRRRRRNGMHRDRAAAGARGEKQHADVDMTVSPRSAGTLQFGHQRHCALLSLSPSLSLLRHSPSPRWQASAAVTRSGTWTSRPWSFKGRGRQYRNIHHGVIFFLHFKPLSRVKTCFFSAEQKHDIRDVAGLGENSRISTKLGKKSHHVIHELGPNSQS